MITSLQKQKSTLLFKTLSSFVAVTFILTMIIPPGSVSAQTVSGLLNLPAPGSLLALSDRHAPCMLQGVSVYYNNPFQFDFILDTGNDRLTSTHQVKEESRKLIKYFLASLTVPEDDLWVNLSPYEEDKIITESLGQTEMGRDMLAQDYLLKQLSSSLIYPEEELGEKFWEKAYEKAYEQYGTTEIPLNTFNKVWIIPDTAVVYTHGIEPSADNPSAGVTAFVVESRLKVMMEEDYMAMKHNMENKELGTGDLLGRDVEAVSSLTADIYRDIVLPEIEREVNEGKSFAPLRQIFNSMVLAVWYKQNLRETILGQVYANKSKLSGVEVEDKAVKKKIYDQYIEALKKGVFNYIREDYDRYVNEPVPRKYFAGGENFADWARQNLRTVSDLQNPAHREQLRGWGDRFKITARLQGLSPKEVEETLRAQGITDINDFQDEAIDALLALAHEDGVEWIKAYRVVVKDVDRVGMQDLMNLPESVRAQILENIRNTRDTLKKKISAGVPGAQIMLDELQALLSGEGQRGMSFVQITDGEAYQELMARLGLEDVELPQDGHASDTYGINLLDPYAMFHELGADSGLTDAEVRALEQDVHLTEEGIWDSISVKLRENFPDGQRRPGLLRSLGFARDIAQTEPDLSWLTEQIRDELMQIEARVLVDIDTGKFTAQDPVSALAVLIKANQEHVIKLAWQAAGNDIERKREFLRQVERLNQTYPPGLAKCSEHGREILVNKKPGPGKEKYNPYVGLIPSLPVPKGEKPLDLGQEYDEFTQIAMEHIGDVVFATPWGGEGARLGWMSGIKADLPFDITTMTPYLGYFIFQILALQNKYNAAHPDQKDVRIPYIMMTHDKTHGQIIRFLNENNYFGMEGLTIIDTTKEKAEYDAALGRVVIKSHDGKSMRECNQIIIFKQDSVPAMQGWEGNWIMDTEKPWLLMEKAHNHGDIHGLMYASGLGQAFADAKKSHTLIFQDTNAEVFRGLIPALGRMVKESQARKERKRRLVIGEARQKRQQISEGDIQDQIKDVGVKVNAIAVKIKPGEKAGTLVRLKNPRTQETIIRNVEYSDRQDFFDHPYTRSMLDDQGLTDNDFLQGNINAFILEQSSYARVLNVEKGIMGEEIVNPKADTLISRLEAMMQDIYIEFPAADVMVTQFDPRLAFAATKNGIRNSLIAASQGLFTEHISQTVGHHWRNNRRLLSAAGAAVKTDVGRRVAFKGKYQYQKWQKIVHDKVMDEKIFVQGWDERTPDDFDKTGWTLVEKGDEINGIDFPSGPVVNWGSDWAQTPQEVKDKWQGGGIYADDAVLIIDQGAGNTRFKNVRIERGALVVKARPDQFLTIEGLTVNNDGWRIRYFQSGQYKYDTKTEQKMIQEVPEYDSMRGYTIYTSGETVIDIRALDAGEFKVDKSGKITPVNIHPRQQISKPKLAPTVPPTGHKYTDRLNIFDDRAAMGEAAAKLGIKKMQRLLKRKKRITIMFAAAPSQVATVEALVRLSKEEEYKIDWTRVNIIHMDEWVTRDSDLVVKRGDEESFRTWLDKHLINPIVEQHKILIEQLHIHLMDDADNMDMTAEEVAEKYGELVKKLGIDGIFGGYGDNGHVAFNDAVQGNLAETKKLYEQPDKGAGVAKPNDDDKNREQQMRDYPRFRQAGYVPPAVTVRLPIMRNEIEKEEGRFIIMSVPGEAKREALVNVHSKEGQPVEADFNPFVPATYFNELSPDTIQVFTDNQGAATLPGIEAISPDRAQSRPGGIDLNPALFTLKVRRDENGVPLPLPQQPVYNINIDGFIPIIIDIVPMPNLNMLLGRDLPLDDTNNERDRYSYLHKPVN